MTERFIPSRTEKCPFCHAPVTRIKGYDNGLSGAEKIAGPDTLQYAPPNSIPVDSAFSELLDAFEKWAVKRAFGRMAFHTGEKWIEDTRASYPTKSYLVTADEQCRASRESLERYVAELQAKRDEDSYQSGYDDGRAEITNEVAPDLTELASLRSKLDRQREEILPPRPEIEKRIDAYRDALQDMEMLGEFITEAKYAEFENKRNIARSALLSLFNRQREEINTLVDANASLTCGPERLDWCEQSAVITDLEAQIERLKAEQTELKREAILAFYNGASATTRRYVTDTVNADHEVSKLNDACERALRRLSDTPTTGTDKNE